MTEKDFELAGIRTVEEQPLRAKRKWYKEYPVVSMLFLGIMIVGCFFCEQIMTVNPTYMDLEHCNVAPGRNFLFGTDTLGRDIFSMIWYGGRVSLLIGFVATAISTAIGVLFGAVSGVASPRADAFLMRAVEIVLSIPNMLMIVLLQAVLGGAGVIGISIVIGITGWMSIAKVVRTEVRQIRNSEYVIASKCMGGSFWHILWRHFLPNFWRSIMFMVVMNVRTAIVAESTLSFMGIGLPLEIVSWGSMLALFQQALMTGSWWMILIPGCFLIVTLMCVTDIGNSLRGDSNQRQSNL